MSLGGWLAGRFGGKHVLGFGLLISSAATVLIPAAVRLNRYLIILLRVIIGASAGVLITSTLSLSGLWFAPYERSFLMSVSRIGITLGSISAFFISSQFCEVPVDNGWPMAFYITGGAGILFWISWNFIVYSSPDKHPRISQRELDYIINTSGIKSTISERPPFPWFRGLTSPAVYAIMVAQTTNAWFAYTSLTSVPLYLRDVLRFDIKQNGLFMILPHLLVILTNIPTAHLADYLIRRKIFSVMTVRKIYQDISSLGSCVILIILAFMDYDRRYIAVALLTSINPVQSICRSGYGVNPLDIAPRYSGEIYGISNTVGTLSGILAPIAVGYLTTNGTKSEWQTVFYIASGLFAGGAIVFTLCAKGEVLPWAAVDQRSSTKPLPDDDNGQAPAVDGNGTTMYVRHVEHVCDVTCGDDDETTTKCAAAENGSTKDAPSQNTSL
jgi:ACS family sodium-dependent inorganic phosphate cotransporter-like MFS transporter 5